KPIIPLLWQEKVDLPLPLLDRQTISFLGNHQAAFEKLLLALNHIEPPSTKVLRVLETSRLSPPSDPPTYSRPLKTTTEDGPFITVALDFLQVIELFTFSIGVGTSVIVGRGPNMNYACIDVTTMNTIYAGSISRKHAILENRDYEL